MTMEINSQTINGVTVISVAGDVDALTAAQLTEFLHRLLATGVNRLVVDLGGVGFMSSAGLRTILHVLRASREAGGDTRLAAVQPGVDSVLEMSGFLRILQAFPTVDEAVASFGD
jgi:anti-sigma B factor antagonist